MTRRYDDMMAIEAVDDRTVAWPGRPRFDIRDFGMDPPRVLMFKVDPEVDVAVDIVAEKEE